MKNIIGHRGAAGLALENSQSALQKALDLKVPQVEIDVRLTEDKKLVVCHDADLSRVSYDLRILNKHTLEQLKGVRLKDRSFLLTLEDALKLIGDLPVIIELKDYGSVPSLLEILKKFPKANVTVASFKLKELQELRKARKSIPTYLLCKLRAHKAINQAQQNGLTGVAPFWLALNEVVYHRAQESGLKMYTYTVNSPWWAGVLRKFYPEVAICTNRPDLLMKKKEQ